MISTKSIRREGWIYLKEVLGILSEITLSSDGEPFRATVELVDPGVFRITIDDNCALLVDANRGVVDDPVGALTDPFQGRLPMKRRYLLTWRDDHGVPVSATVEASSRRFARLFVDAPAQAYVERV